MEMFTVLPLEYRCNEAAVELCRWLSEGSGSGSGAGAGAGAGASAELLQRLEAARAAGDFGAFLQALLAAGGEPPLLLRGTPEDVSAAFALMIVLLAAVAKEKRAEVVGALADLAAGPAAAAGDAQAQAALAALEPRAAQARLRTLAALLNALTERELKLHVLRRLVAFAADTRQLALDAQLAAFLASAPSWGLAEPQAASLFLLVSQSYGRVGAAEEEQQWLVKYLQTLERGAGAAASAEAIAQDAAALEAAIPSARAAAIAYIKAPAGAQKYEVPRLRAVSQRAERASRRAAPRRPASQRRSPMMRKNIITAPTRRAPSCPGGCEAARAGGAARADEASIIFSLRPRACHAGHHEPILRPFHALS